MTLSGIKYELNQFKIFSDLNEFELARLDDDKVISFHKKGKVVYYKGSRLPGFYCVIDGIIKNFIKMVRTAANK